MKIMRRGSGRGIAGALLALSLCTAAFADGPAISGYVDSQYGYNFNKPANGVTMLRSYDFQDNNIANTAHVALTGSLDGGAGYVIGMDAGHDPQTTFGAVGQSSVYLREAYLTYVCPITKIGIKAGKFVTFEGIEVIDTAANPTISRGYLFGLAEPFTHVGGVLTYTMGKVDVAAGVVNGWDVADDNNKGKTVVGKVGLNWGDPLTATLSGYHGPEQTNNVSANRDSLDLTVLSKIIPKVDLWLQGNLGTESRVALDANGNPTDRGNWSGVAIEPLVHVSDKFTVGARAEYFADKQGARTGIVNNCAKNFTVTPGYMLTKNLQVRAEYRYDKSNKKLWQDDKGTAKDSTNTGTLQFVVTF